MRTSTSCFCRRVTHRWSITPSSKSGGGATGTIRPRARLACPAAVLKFERLAVQGVRRRPSRIVLYSTGEAHMLDCVAQSVGVHGRCFHGCFQKPRCAYESEASGESFGRSDQLFHHLVSAAVTGAGGMARHGAPGKSRANQRVDLSRGGARDSVQPVADDDALSSLQHRALSRARNLRNGGESSDRLQP
jgi:hypothetical protein